MCAFYIIFFPIKFHRLPVFQSGSLHEANQHPLSLVSLLTGTAKSVLGHVHESGMLKPRNRNNTLSNENGSSSASASSSQSLQSFEDEKRSPMTISFPSEAISRKRRDMRASKENGIIEHDEPCKADAFISIEISNGSPEIINCAETDNIHDTIGESIVFPGDMSHIKNSHAGEHKELGEAIGSAPARQKRDANNEPPTPTVVLNYDLIVEYTNAKFHHENISAPIQLCTDCDLGQSTANEPNISTTVEANSDTKTSTVSTI